MIRINLKPEEPVPEILLKMEKILWAILALLPVAMIIWAKIRF